MLKELAVVVMLVGAAVATSGDDVDPLTVGGINVVYIPCGYRKQKQWVVTGVRISVLENSKKMQPSTTYTLKTAVIPKFGAEYVMNNMSMTEASGVVVAKVTDSIINGPFIVGTPTILKSNFTTTDFKTIGPSQSVTIHVEYAANGVSAVCYRGYVY